MNRRSTLKVLSISSAVLSFLPALVYYLFNAKSLRANNCIVKLNELYVLFAISFIGFVSHVGVYFVSTDLGLGAAFFKVSLFVHITVVAALLMFYKAAHYTDHNAEREAQQSGNKSLAN